MTKHRAIVVLALCGLLVGLAGAARADSGLDLLGGRFQVSAEWRTADGTSGTAQAKSLTNETGLFWFFSQTNTELVVKVLNACTPYNRFWVFAAGLTDVEVELTVEDTWTGQTQTYLRPRGVLFAPLADTSTFDGCDAVKPSGVGLFPSAHQAAPAGQFTAGATRRANTRLELSSGRFQVSAEWRTADGTRGAAQAVPLSPESGLFWFFSETNAELFVKVLDACNPPFHHFWLYAAGLTDVDVELTVEDTWTGQSQSYHQPGGSLFTPIADTSTFNGCNAVRACGQGTVSEIAATPRPYYEVESLALLLGSGITADPEIYLRLVGDLERIRTLWPSLAHIEHQFLFDPNTLLVGLTPGAHQAALAGQLTEWDCLNSWYGGQVKTVWTIIPWAVISFEGLFHPLRIGNDYLNLPGVTAIEADVPFFFPGIPPASDLCAAIDGTAYDYFLFDGLTYKTWYFRVPHAGATPVLIGSTGPGPQPDWWARYEQCWGNLYSAAFP